MSNDKKLSLADWLGFRDDTIREDTRWLGKILGNAILALGLLLLCLFVAMLVLLTLAMFSQDDKAEDVRNIGLVLAAIVGAPFLVWRSYVAAKQADTSEQGLITERINKAVEGLGAEKEINRLGRQITIQPADGSDHINDFEWQDDLFKAQGDEKVVKRNDWQSIKVTLPNLEVRIGAIFALERISQDSPRDHVQIMEILCAYIRENAPADQAETFPEPDWQPLPDDADNAARAAHAALRKERFGRVAFGSKAHKWAQTLKSRSDIQIAINVIGRRTEAQVKAERRDLRHGETGYRLDLRKANLQGCDLSRLDLRNALLSGARMEGADLCEARMEGAFLRQARMEGVDLREARMEGANLSGARMEGANLVRARMEGANLFGARMEGANLSGARMKGAFLNGACMEGAFLNGTRMQGAFLNGAWMEGASLSGAWMEGANLSDARMEGADLIEARMKGAFLRKTRFSESTDFRSAIVQYAAVKSKPLLGIGVDQDLVNSLYGDDSVDLGDLKKPAHWGDGDLDYFEFQEKWRAWQRSQGYEPPQ